MENEKIFVVVPVYKVEPYLERCIDSILNQTLTNWELILVDDGSPDNCPAICDRYAAEYDNITVIHQENGGLSAARNAGINHAMANGNPETDWITFIDSDDFIHPNYLEYLYRAAKEASTEISICGYIRTDAAQVSGEKTDFGYTVFTPEAFWRKDRTNATVAWGKLYRLHCFRDIRYPVGKIHEDEFTTYKVMFPLPQVVFVGITLYYYYSNSAGITQTPWTPKRMDELDALTEQMAYFRETGFSDAYSLSARDLLQHSIKYLMYIKHLSPKYDSYVREVKVWRRHAFRLYAQAVGRKKAIRYWYQVRIKTPMQRVLGRESAFSFLKRRIKRKLGI